MIWIDGRNGDYFVTYTFIYIQYFLQEERRRVREGLGPLITRLQAGRCRRRHDCTCIVNVFLQTRRVLPKDDMCTNTLNKIKINTC